MGATFRLASFAAKALAAGKPSPPLRAEPATIWNVFFLYASLVLGGSSLIISLPELIVLAVLKSRDGWEGCAAVDLTVLVGCSVALGVLSFCISPWGSSALAIASQWALCATEAALATTMIGIGAQVLASSSIRSCYLAAVSLGCGVLALFEGLPTLGLWTALLALSWHRDSNELPLVNLYRMLPPQHVERALCVPQWMRASTLYAPAEKSVA